MHMQSQNPKRKSLEDLLSDPETQAFVQNKANFQHADMSERQHANIQTRQHVESRVSVSVKVSKPIADALWQAMHERTSEYKRKTLAPGEPYEKQDIVAQAIEQWLRAKGYLQ